jgi:putative ABC transport system permease protein
MIRPADAQPPRGRPAYRWLLALLPRAVRQAAAPDLEAMAAACVTREQARFGRPGVWFAWIRLASDVIVAAAAIRFASPSPPDPHAPKRGALEATMDMLRNDLTFALRTLRRQPGFAAITLLTLTLGIGANTAIFSVVNGVLLRPLPYAHPDELEFVTSQFTKMGLDHFWLDLGEYHDFRAHNRTFSSVGAYGTGTVTLGGDVPSRPLAAQVTPDLMPTLGVVPVAGRWFTPEDAQPGAEPVVILSAELWRHRFGSDPSVVGRTITIGTKSTRVVGIMPPGFDLHDQKIDLYVPLTIDPAQIESSRGGHFLYLVARRKPGVTPAAAAGDITRMVAEWATYAPAGAHVPDPKLHPLRIDPLKEDVVGSVRLALLMLQGAVAFVLLIACVNLANLLLARADARQREFAVRTALGAGRARLLRQFVVEGLVLALIAAAAGSLLAWLVVHALVALNPDAIPRSAGIAVDVRVLAFTLGLAVVTGIIFGAVPLRHVHARLGLSLRDGARTAGGPAKHRIRGLLVIAEVTLAVVLVAGAGLLVRSFINLLNVDPGFNRSHLVTFDVVAPVITGLPEEQRPAQRVRIVHFFNDIRDRLAALPGAQDAAGMIGLPPNRPIDANDTMFEWLPTVPKGQQSPYPIPNVDFYQAVTLGYTETMGIPVIRGRAFNAGDVGGPPVVLVNETLARKFFTDFNRDPIGEHIKPGYASFNNESWFTIVGVVRDVKQRGVDAPTGTELYALQDQMPQWGHFAYSEMNFVVRTTAPVEGLAGPIRQIVHELDARAPVVKLRTMDEVFGESVARPKFLTLLLGIFALLALTLAAVGTYGVLSYLVTARHQEIGVRMALGADTREILWLFLTRGVVLAGAGLVIGLAGSLALQRLMGSLLFGVRATDPATIACVSGAVILVAATASFVPSWRATRVDPLTVLREG